jgi:hypothetical protein
MWFDPHQALADLAEEGPPRANRAKRANPPRPSSTSSTNSTPLAPHSEVPRHAPDRFDTVPAQPIRKPRLEDVRGTGAAAIVSGSRRSVHDFLRAFEAIDGEGLNGQ